MTIANIELVKLSEIESVTDEEIIHKLKYSLNYADILALAKRDMVILHLCDELGIYVSEDEVQKVGDAFRKSNKLHGAPETLRWLSENCISPEDWAKGIQVSLLTDKLKNHTCGDLADDYYLGNRENCTRVALSQILVGDLATAIRVTQAIKENDATFFSLALEYSRGKQSSENGGFVGTKLVAELLPEISQSINDTKEGDVVGPIHSKMGYHILRIEKWFPAEFSQVKDKILDYLFENWLNEKAGLVN